MLYVETLIGPDTVNTMTLGTLAAFRDHGRVARTVDRDMPAAHQVIRRFEAAGFRLADITAQVLKEGVEKFNHSLDQLLQRIDTKRDESILRKG